MPPRHGPVKESTGRLAPLAPREDQAPPPSPGPSSSPALMPSTTSSETTRSRLPPRSRSGCWTCRKRKVKCDEGRPRCQQCLRLGHRCDYSAKLAFKDETPKIVDKYVGSGPASPAWDTNVDPLSGVDTSHPSEQDRMPPFTSLANDEDWQRKAEHRPPGTYYVVANSSSFTDVEEYRQTTDTLGGVSVPSNDSLDATGSNRSPNVPLDSRTIILGSFDDTLRRQNLVPTYTALSPESDSGSTTLASPLSSNLAQGFNELRVSQGGLNESEVSSDLGSDESSRMRLQYQYRTVVRWHILQNYSLPPDLSAQVEDAFEREAKEFEPLEYALGALSALSLSRQDSSQSVTALQQYQQAIKALMHEQDIASNGSFLTHFILLVYEIAGSEAYWSEHMNFLTRSILLRRRKLDSEPFPYVIWWACLIDLNALLSGSGNGGLFLSLIQQNLVPTEYEMNQAPPFLGSAAFLEGGREMLTATWSLQRAIGIAAAQIGESAIKIREMHERISAGGPISSAHVQNFRRQMARAIEVLHQAWKSAWSTELRVAVKEKTLSEEAYAVFISTRLMFHSCVIFVHTSMWPKQQNDLAHDDIKPIYDAAAQIIELAQETVQTRRTERRFVVYPLLLAGTVLPSTDAQQQIRSLLGAFQHVTLGSNTRATAKVLEAVRAQHAYHNELGSQVAGYDLVGKAKEQQSKLINYGL